MNFKISPYFRFLFDYTLFQSLLQSDIRNCQRTRCRRKINCINL